ncbi:hypothetical protein L207DRAFT_629519 [Hyaloscypha variabilis F]|uniref:Stc1 domain-containing protein n=1 Tax=Hyaloscypha variabilis (strain UAMH 11265 / GT02V1 / F) TaxID=1149755 RepID=A0A2J6S2J7_HYAVF|nr:hypothetical protein L207DRAFT_629519 [Hyaloscypha variabilis F]
MAGIARNQEPLGLLTRTVGAKSAAGGVPLLEKYKRRVCLKFKDNSSCSNTQLKVYKHKKRVGDDINAVTAKRRCRQCTGGNVTELQCQGCCGLVLAIGQFYGQARRAGGSQWRKACSAWKEAQEPGVTTAPATAADVALDEQEVSRDEL